MTTPDMLKPFWGPRTDSAVSPPAGSAPLNFSDPADNLYAFGKIWATYADKPRFQFGDGGDAPTVQRFLPYLALVAADEDGPERGGGHAVWSHAFPQVQRRVHRHPAQGTGLHGEALPGGEDWDDGYPIGTWEAYARDVLPETS